MARALCCLTTCVILVSPHSCYATVVLNEAELNGAASRIELFNNGGSTVNVNDWWVCSLFNYQQMSSLNIVSGSTNLGPGQYLVVSGFNLTNSADLGLYTVNTFGSSAAMESFVQWGSSGNGRESVAATKGIWTAGDFISPVSGVGQSMQYDGSGFLSTDWLVAAPTFGGVNVPEPTSFISFIKAGM